MHVVRPHKDIVEIFGYAPNDTSVSCRSLWELGACPFVRIPCIKKNHESTVVYGTCSVTTPYGDCVICPNRLYVNNFAILRQVAFDAFGEIPFYTYSEYIEHREESRPFVVLLGMHSGHEINLRSACSMDWVIAKVENHHLVGYTGIEVQSIDITGNYRDNWYAYKHIQEGTTIPSSMHGLNWANVHKRLIPQIIRKSIIYSKSNLVSSGLYFIVPDIVYRKFEEIIGNDIPLVQEKAADVITVHTYELGPVVSEGQVREILPVRRLRFKQDEFSKRFISGANLPSAAELDSAIADALGLAR